MQISRHRVLEAEGSGSPSSPLSGGNMEKYDDRGCVTALCGSLLCVDLAINHKPSSNSTCEDSLCYSIAFNTTLGSAWKGSRDPLIGAS